MSREDGVLKWEGFCVNLALHPVFSESCITFEKIFDLWFGVNNYETGIYLPLSCPVWVPSLLRGCQTRRMEGKEIYRPQEIKQIRTDPCHSCCEFWILRWKLRLLRANLPLCWGLLSEPACTTDQQYPSFADVVLTSLIWSPADFRAVKQSS